MEDHKNGTQPAVAALTTSAWVRDDFVNGRRCYKVYTLQAPVRNIVNPEMMARGAYPQLAGNPTVIAEATLIVPNLEVAKFLVAAIAEMIAKQPPEILQVKAG